MSTPRPPFNQAKLVQVFRGEARASIPLHPMERALVIVACVHLCFVAWALGGREVWAQWICLALGAGSLVLAVLPRRYDGELAGPQGPFVLHPWSRLLRLPVFWLGLALLGYALCQALNPAWVRVTAHPYWWLVPAEHVAWLPTGVKAPFALMNAWRTLVIWGGVWALGCALFVGLTRRTAVQTILVTVVVNGTVLALVGILQKVTHAKDVLWSIKPVASYFVATFFYKNHGGAFFNIILVITLALAAWHYVRALRRMERSSPAPVYFFAAIVLAAIVFMSGSRTAMILLSGYLVAGLGVFLVWRFRGNEDTTHPAVTGLIVTGTVALVAVSAWFLNLDKGIEQIRTLTTQQGQRTSIESRLLARQATLDLFEMQPTTGWGAGSFQHAFPMVQKNYDSIYHVDGGRRILSWDHAHNDYVQALMELGWAGFLLPVGIVLAMFWRACRSGALRQPSSILFLIGMALPLAHAWVDFPLHNVAILTTFCAAFVLLARWVELETAR